MSLYWCECYSITRSQLCLDWVAWLCKHETALPHTISFGDHRSPSSPALALTESIHVGMSLYLMSVYSITRSQLCWDGCLIMLSMRLLLLTQFIWRTNLSPSLCCSGTHRINTCSNVTVPDVSVFHRKSQLCLRLVLDYVSMRLLSLTQFIWDHPSPSSPSSGLTESIHIGMSRTWMSVYSITRSSNCVNAMNDCSSLTHSLETIVLQLCCSGTHRINTSSNVTVLDVSVSIAKVNLVLRLGAWLL